MEAAATFWPIGEPPGVAASASLRYRLEERKDRARWKPSKN